MDACRVSCIKLIFLAILTMMLSGCSGYIRVQGTVYKQPATAAIGKSTGYIDAQVIPPGGERIPLDNVKITIFHGVDDPKSVERTYARKDEAYTDKNGYFKFSTVTLPFRFKLVMRVEKEGYESIDIPFEHVTKGSIDHTATIFLVPTEPGVPPTPQKSHFKI